MNKLNISYSSNNTYKLTMLAWKGLKLHIWKCELDKARVTRTKKKKLWEALSVHCTLNTANTNIIKPVYFIDLRISLYFFFACLYNCILFICLHLLYNVSALFLTFWNWRTGVSLSGMAEPKKKNKKKHKLIVYWFHPFHFYH